MPSKDKKVQYGPNFDECILISQCLITMMLDRYTFVRSPASLLFSGHLLPKVNFAMFVYNFNETAIMSYTTSVILIQNGCYS